jgi:hypothetical protein
MCRPIPKSLSGVKILCWFLPHPRMMFQQRSPGIAPATSAGQIYFRACLNAKNAHLMILILGLEVVFCYVLSVMSKDGSASAATCIRCSSIPLIASSNTGIGPPVLFGNTEEAAPPLKRRKYVALGTFTYSMLKYTRDLSKVRGALVVFQAAMLLHSRRQEDQNIASKVKVTIYQVQYVFA